jgi:RNA polymerase sigma-70 factor, ECF subfamily
VFERYRPDLVALAYRMLGDVTRAEDIVQDAWMRWQTRKVEVDAPKAFLLTIVTRLCLNELDSARVRHEESRSDRLPEPIDLENNGLNRLETLDQISMAFLVLLQRLTPPERAVLLLHDVFGLSHAEIAAHLDRSDAACRQLLSRARENVTAERRVFETSRDEHTRMLQAFVRAAGTGDHREMLGLLADDATLIIDAGAGERRVGKIRNLGRPVRGAKRIAAFLAAVSGQREGFGSAHLRILNGQPAIVMIANGAPRAAVFVSVADGRIRHVFVQADPARLTHLGPLN